MSATSEPPSPSPSSTPTHIRIFTLNCWGLKYIAKHRNARLAEIGRQLAIASPPPEIVGLQECWTQQDYESIRQQTRHILPYGKFYFGGIWGAGLAILSKWPIEESSMFAYPLNGRPTAFFRGDWYVGKGVACARVRFGPGVQDVAEVFCTHLHAPYEREPNDSYICHRTAQAWEIAKLMRGAAERGHLVIGLGDFNMLPSSFAHQLIQAHSPVRDAWQVLHPDSSVGAAIDPVEQKRGKPVPSAEYNLTENGATCDGKFNTWRWSKEDQKRLEKGQDIVVDKDAPCPKGKRLDYIFVGDGNYPPLYPAPRWSVESTRLSMTERHPTLRCSLSDHFAVEAVITRIPSEKAANDTSITHHSPAPNAALTPDTYDRIIDMIHTYVRRERSQRRWRVAHFLASVIISIGCFIGVWWTGDHLPYVAFILVLVSTLSFGAGILDGLIGGLFMSSELRALKEFEWEVRNAKMIAEAVGGKGEKVE
ncbi:phospholipase C type enzyme [Aspergillus tubingensis]|uniref:Sphingomyelinase family protein n=2 Tax=Aspergillus subgen. Circumdati TaxID=2720871 RepID=A0A100IIZ1_ASPNG|nr:sphingomyelinase family protein [Aspergillus tubingensis]GAQ42072.1 sphingomyelinase family protein [Aspergillus niger]GFN16682.1 sphingomyelinase family protein [Aspergillus tubingensis]GLA63062.1 phospholipase C type enzyme [Aspergillus tubingensis]GLA68759.1 phospholipase C type enzyme [Aspergillus tubingensis]GLA81648.1 phospholipase C type enzyme [Aspergillus tubingensis]